MEALSQSLEDYIEAIYLIVERRREENADAATALVKEVASEMGVKMPSVVKALRELKRLGLVMQEPYGDIRMTSAGRAVALRVSGRHSLLREFLMQLGVSRKNADRDACKMEHFLSAETLERIRNFTKKKEK